MSLDSLSHKRLLIWAGEERLKTLERLAYGALSPEQYHYSCGYINAIDTALKELEAIIAELQGA